MSVAEPTVFQPVDRLPSHLISTSRQVSKFSGRYLSLGEDPKFDWVGFKNAIDHYPGDDLTFEQYNRSTIHQQTQTTEEMVSKVAEFLYKALSASIDRGQLEAIVKSTFTNLKEMTLSQSGFLNFTTNSKKGNSAWQYRILFSVPFGPDAPEWFYSLVTTIKIIADVQEKSSWWGLTSSTTKNFAVQIDALRLVIQRGFRAPA